jgi:hypothetical protein
MSGTRFVLARAAESATAILGLRRAIYMLILFTS